MEKTDSLEKSDLLRFLSDLFHKKPYKIFRINLASIPGKINHIEETDIEESKYWNPNPVKTRSCLTEGMIRPECTFLN